MKQKHFTIKFKQQTKMKKVILFLLFSMAVFAQKVKPITIGIEKVADSISVSVMTFKTTDKTCQLYYEVFDAKKVKIDDGNLQMTEQEFSQWGETNKYIEDLALVKLKLERKVVLSKLIGSIETYKFKNSNLFELINNTSSQLVLRNPVYTDKKLTLNK